MSERIEIIQDHMYKQLNEFGQSILSDAPDGRGVNWPDPAVQARYTGASGSNLMRRTVDFAWVLQRCVPELSTGAWKGLDYGVGWGRIASMLGAFGNPDSLDCVDAWQRSIDLAKSGGLQNRFQLVSALLQECELPGRNYDFIYAYSIFTHLPETHILHNLGVLCAALRPGGKLILTVREPKFLDYLKNNDRKVSAVDDSLEARGYWFGNAQNSEYGDTVITSDWIKANLEDLGEISTLGHIGTEPYQTIMKITTG